MRINVAVPEEHISAPILDAALEANTRVNESLIRSGVVPKFRDAVRGGVRWKPEPPGAEHFDHALTVIERDWGDCDDLAPYRAAELRVTGEDRGAIARVKKSGPKTWHAYVERSNAPDEDPSVEAGMRSRNGARAATLPLLGVHGVGAYTALPRLAIRPIIDPRSNTIEAWQARADLPWHYAATDSPLDVAMASLHRSPDASQAIVGACQGCMVIGAEMGHLVEPVDLEYLEAMSDANMGADWEDIADEYGEEIADEVANSVGALFGGIKKALTPARKLLKSKGVRFVAPLVNPAGYALARGADAMLDREGNIVQKFKGFGGGIARGYGDRFSNPVFKGAAKKFGMGDIAKGLEKGTAFAAQSLEKGGSLKDAAQALKHGGGALMESYGAKVPPIAKMATKSLAAARVHVPKTHPLMRCAIAAVR